MTLEEAAEVNARAAEWWRCVRLQTPSPETRAAFEAWRISDPRHAMAFARTERLWQALGGIGQLHQGQLLLDETAVTAGESSFAARTGWRLRRYLPAAAAAVFLLAAIPLALHLLPPQGFATRTAEIREFAMPDGSRVTLGAKSRVDWTQTARERRASLEDGEAFFDVRKNAEQPFVVDVDDVLIRVLGTRFNVRRGVTETTVTVQDGRVEVLRADQPTQRLEASQQITLRKGQLPMVATLGSATPAGAWRNGRLIYDGAPLVEVVADANRYYAPGISLGSDDLAALKVTTALEVSQIGLMLDSLAVVLPLTVKRRPGGHLVLERRP